MQAKSFEFNVADFSILIESKDNSLLVFEDGYTHFISETSKRDKDFDVTVEAYCGIPDLFKKEDEKVFEAKQDGFKLWRIEKTRGGFKFIIQNQRSIGKIQQVAFATNSFKNWKIYCEEIEQDGHRFICPLLYPFGPLLMYYLTYNSDALMVHASGVFDGENGRIFSGFSGVGKSTMAKIWQSNGSKIINDDRLIIRKIKQNYYFYNTPMFYEDEPKKSPLNYIYLPFHSPKNSFEKLNVKNAVESFFPFCIQHSYNSELMERHLDVISDLCSVIPVSKLGVVPTKEVITFIKDND